MSGPTHAALSELSIDKANVRKTGRGQEPMYVASIKAKGIIEPLIVRANGSGYHVTNGGKRLASLQYMRDRKMTAAGIAVTDAYPVPILIRAEDDTAARETSLMTNIIRTGMHPVDRFEAFSELAAQGKSVEDIAADYALTVPQVRQSLAIAKIAEPIRKAWHEGKITAAGAEAFAGADIKTQEAVFKRQQKVGAWGLQPHNVKRELGTDDREVSALLKFVGQEAYEAAGHHVNQMLFADRDDADDSVSVSNTSALKQLARNKIDAECKKLTDAGWAWACLDDDLGKNVSKYMMQNVNTRGGGWTKEEMARSGVVIEIERGGKLSMIKGKLKPGQKAPKEKAGKSSAAGVSASPATPKPDVSNALKQRITSAVAQATKEALIEVTKGSTSATFALSVLLAQTIADEIAVDRYFDTPHGIRDALPKIRNAINPAIMTAALTRRFDDADYFKGVSRKMVEKAIKEAGLVDQAKAAMKGTRGVLNKFAVAHVKKAGWLPPEFRTAHYTGPGAKKTAKPAPRKKAA